MNTIKENTTARICLFLTKLSWYLFLILGVLLSVTIILAYAGNLPQYLNFGLTLPLDQSVVNLTSDIDQSAISVESARGQLDISYFAQQFPDEFLSFSFFILLFLGMLLMGLYQLKKLLQTAIDDMVFTSKNTNRIKIIALLVFLVDPLYWIYQNFFFEGLFSDTSTSQIELISNLPFDYWFIGLLIYTLAAIFEKGTEMYQELKLTV